MPTVTNLAPAPRTFNIVNPANEGLDQKDPKRAPPLQATLVPGESADLAILDEDHPAFTGMVKTGEIRLGDPTQTQTSMASDIEVLRKQMRDDRAAYTEVMTEAQAKHDEEIKALEDNHQKELMGKVDQHVDDLSSKDAERAQALADKDAEIATLKQQVDDLSKPAATKK